MDERLLKYFIEKVRISIDINVQITNHYIAYKLHTSKIFISKLQKKPKKLGK
jgi:hypothetical protein